MHFQERERGVDSSLVSSGSHDPTADAAPFVMGMCVLTCLCLLWFMLRRDANPAFRSQRLMRTAKKAAERFAVQKPKS